MPETTALLTFLTALFFLEITRGPDMMPALARGIGQGRRIALLNVFGMILLFWQARFTADPIRPVDGPRDRSEWWETA